MSIYIQNYLKTILSILNKCGLNYMPYIIGIMRRIFILVSTLDLMPYDLSIEEAVMERPLQAIGI